MGDKDRRNVFIANTQSVITNKPVDPSFSHQGSYHLFFFGNGFLKVGKLRKYGPLKMSSFFWIGNVVGR